MALSISAAPVTFYSGDSFNEGNDKSPANVVLVPHGVWASTPNASWISFTNSGAGAGGTVLPNDSTTPFARFWETFTLAPNTSYTGKITVWADDTADVYLNGHLLKSAAPDQGSACASEAPSCVQDKGFEYLVDGSFLKKDNTLEIAAYQRGGDVAGILYSGSIDSVGRSITATPEPVTYGLIGVGLAALGLFRARRRL